MDEASAEHYLRFIGYYRLGGYCLPFQIPNDSRHTFKAGAKFSDVLELYTFDRELRLLSMDAIERIEVAFRTCVSNYMSGKYEPHWFLDHRLYRGGKTGFFAKFVQIVVDKTGCKVDGFPPPRREPEPFLQRYFAKYKEPKLPPSWMIAEVLSISDWSCLYEEIEKREDRRAIAGQFNLPAEVLQSWIHAIAYVRNICAHHSRLWNREFTIKPLIAEKFKRELTPNNRFHAQAFVLNQLVQTISPKTTWAKRLRELMDSYPSINKSPMGFQTDWVGLPTWNGL